MSGFGKWWSLPVESPDVGARRSCLARSVSKPATCRKWPRPHVRSRRLKFVRIITWLESLVFFGRCDVAAALGSWARPAVADVTAVALRVLRTLRSTVYTIYFKWARIMFTITNRRRCCLKLCNCLHHHKQLSCFQHKPLCNQYRESVV